MAQWLDPWNVGESLDQNRQLIFVTADYHADRAATNRRKKKLQAYLTKNVWDPTTKSNWSNFACEFKKECKSSAIRRGAEFFEAQGHSVGPHYDLSTLKGTPLRVLIAPMEVGGGPEEDTKKPARFATVERRTERVHHSGLKDFADRNAHMRGVTLALQLAFGLPAGGTEHLHLTNRKKVHIFDAFAMTNLLMCSSVAKKDSQASKSTAVMRQSCATHLAETVQILQPTLVISQGWGLVDTLRTALGATNEGDGLGLSKCCLFNCDLNGHRFVWVALYHPTRFWSSPNQTYFTNTVEPAIKAARRQALQRARGC